MNRANAALRIFFRWIVSLALLFFLFRTTNWHQLGNLLQEIRWWLAAPVLVALWGTNLWAAWAWQYLVSVFARIRLSLTEAAQLYFIAQAFGSITPMNVGNDLYRIQAITARKGPLGETMLAIILQRFTSAQALLFLASACSFIAPVSEHMSTTLAGVALVLVLGSFAAAGLAVMGKKWLGKKLPSAKFSSRQLIKAFSVSFVLAIGFHLSGGILGGLLVSIAGIDLPFPTAVASIVLARVSILLPFTVNGLGIMEGTLAYLFSQFAATAEEGLTVALLLRVVSLITGVSGAVLFWRKKRKEG